VTDLGQYRDDTGETAERDAAALDAATAFENMRRQLALLTAATEGFAARQAALEARDYAPDLARLAGAMERTHEAINILNRRPGVSLTPETVATQIEAAAIPLRRADHDALREAAQALDQATRRIEGIISRVRTREKQIDALIWAVMGGIIVTIILFALGGVLAEHRGAMAQSNTPVTGLVEQHRQQ
jgi:cell division protein ZapA (FtsZ GTPase activity inhibitor)